MSDFGIYSGINPFGQYRKTWEWEDLHDLDQNGSQAGQREHLGSLVWYSFSSLAVSESILSSWKPEKSALNTFTIERSLRSLKNYLGFEFPHPQEVVQYLLAHPGLYIIALDTCFSVKEVFGHNSQISLELYHDPEIHDEYLTIFVRQENYEPDIIEKIDAISTDYEIALAGESGYLLINTDFCPPMV
jgi:hypothetical protein